MVITAKTKANTDNVDYIIGMFDSKGSLRPSMPIVTYGVAEEFRSTQSQLEGWSTNHVIVSDQTPKSDHLVSDVNTDFMQEVLQFVLYGRNLNEFKVLIVQHPKPNGEIDIHVLISRLHLPRQTRDFSPFDDKSDYEHGDQFKLFSSAVSKKYGLQDPGAPTLQENVKKNGATSHSKMKSARLMVIYLTLCAKDSLPIFKTY